MRRARDVLAVVFLVSACISGPGETRYIDVAADYELFVDTVQPVLAERCANPSCHGNSGRPLQLFAIHQHRLDATQVFADAPLTEQELTLNYQRSLAFVTYRTSLEDCPLIAKPLAEQAGGVWHGGGVQFYESDDPECDTIRTWLEDTAYHQGHGAP